MRGKRDEPGSAHAAFYLLFSVMLTFVQVLIAAAGANQAVGLPTLAGNREGLPELTGCAGRARRAHLNMIENMVLFARAGADRRRRRQGQRHDRDGRPDLLLGAPRLCRDLPDRRPLAAHAAWAVSVIGMVMIAWVLLQAL